MTEHPDNHASITDQDTVPPNGMPAIKDKTTNSGKEKPERIEDANHKPEKPGKMTYETYYLDKNNNFTDPELACRIVHQAIDENGHMVNEIWEDPRRNHLEKMMTLKNKIRRKTWMLPFSYSAIKRLRKELEEEKEIYRKIFG